MAIKDATGCTITAPEDEAAKITGVDRAVKAGDVVMLGGVEAQVMNVSGHTLGHIAYHLEMESLAFVGDSIFALGCGRMFEGTPQMMWDSLKRIRDLPDDTVLYCAA